jgi:hypothetical protein
MRDLPLDLVGASSPRPSAPQVCGGEGEKVRDGPGAMGRSEWKWEDSNGLGVHYLDILTGEPLYMVVFALLCVGDLVH